MGHFHFRNFILLLTFVSMMACGDSRNGDRAASRQDHSVQEVDVQLNEFEIVMPHTLQAGTIKFAVENTGKAEHNFTISGNGITKEFSTNLSPGERKVLEVDLTPGIYQVYCPVLDHRGHGMDMELRVNEKEN